MVLKMDFVVISFSRHLAVQGKDWCIKEPINNMCHWGWRSAETDRTNGLN
jgi:hypothetical protein